MLSVCLLVAAWVVRVGLRLAPAKLLKADSEGGMPVDPRRLGAALTRAAWVLLCSGSYVLFDIAVPDTQLRLRVRLI